MLNSYYKIAAIIVIAVLVAGAVLIFLPVKINTTLGGNKEFTIERGQSLSVTAQLLAEQHLILSRYLFMTYAILIGRERDFQAGRYLMPRAVSIYRLVKTFSNGLAESSDIEVILPEGTNVADMAKLLTKKDLIDQAVFIRAALPFEGYLFPDTYRLTSPLSGSLSSATGGIIQKMKDNFRAKTANIFRGLNEQQVERALVIASILEKEVRTEKDMHLVAGIIEKRLRLGMPLQIDATVAYGVCRPQLTEGRFCDVSLANIVDNIQKDSIYNTYSRKGLPAGPISSPGLKAIRAALNPEPSDYIFYLSTKDGTTVFSRTSAEHLRAKQKYLN